MAEFLTDPSVLTKDKLKSALVANNVALPNGEQRKGVYVELYLKNLTSQNKRSGGFTEAFSSDEEPAAPAASITARSGRKATRKTDRVRPEEIDVTELTNEELKDQLLKYGVSAGPIVASTRKVYEKKLQKLLDQGPPQTTVIAVSEPLPMHNSRNGNTDSDQYSDKEEETTAVPELEPEIEPEPEPIPVVERPLRSRGKTPVTTRTRSSQHKEEDDESEEEDPQVVNVKRKWRSSGRLDPAVPDHVLASEMLPVPRERKRFSALPKDPAPLQADTLPGSPSESRGGLSESPGRRTASVLAAVDDYDQAVSTDESAAALPKACGEEVQHSLLNTALLEVGPHEALSSRPAHVVGTEILMLKGSSPELNSVSSLKRTKRPNSPCSASARPSRDLIHTMCRLSPSQASQGKDSPRSLSLMDSPGFPAKSSPDVKIEKLSAVEQTPKTAERDVLKELFPNEVLSTPTGISATRRQPIKGAAGRPFSDTWQDSLRPRVTEHRYTTSSYTETRSVPRVGAVPRVSVVPLSVPKPAAPPSIQAKARRRVPVWVQLLLLAAVAGFLLFIYQAMESNQMSPFGQPSHNNVLENSGK